MKAPLCRGHSHSFGLCLGLHTLWISRTLFVSVAWRLIQPWPIAEEGCRCYLVLRVGKE